MCKGKRDLWQNRLAHSSSFTQSSAFATSDGNAQPMSPEGVRLRQTWSLYKIRWTSDLWNKSHIFYMHRIHHMHHMYRTYRCHVSHMCVACIAGITCGTCIARHPLFQTYSINLRHSCMFASHIHTVLFHRAFASP